MSLTDIQIRNAKPDKKNHRLTDGGGLYLLLKPIGAKLWRYGYRFNHNRKTLALGIYPEISLAEARKRHIFL